VRSARLGQTKDWRRSFKATAIHNSNAQSESWVNRDSLLALPSPPTATKSIGLTAPSTKLPILSHSSVVFRALSRADLPTRQLVGPPDRLSLAVCGTRH